MANVGQLRQDCRSFSHLGRGVLGKGFRMIHLLNESVETLSHKLAHGFVNANPPDLPRQGIGEFGLGL